MLNRSLRSKDLAVERLSWTLLAALSGVSVGMSACAGRSERQPDEAEAGDGGTGGRGASGSGGKQSKGTGGSGNAPGTGGSMLGTGGTSSNTGGFASGGSDSAGTGAFAGVGASAGSSPQGGAGNGGGAGEPPTGCAAAAPYGELEQCDGGFVHRPEVTTCALPERVGAGEGGAGGTPGAGGTAGTDMLPLEHQCDTDLDCSTSANGYCTIDEASMVGPQRVCIYACSQDSDCDSGEICSCADSFIHAVDEAAIALGRCKPAACASDADCGDMLCIAPVDANCGPARPGGFHCQSPDDECGGPGDCIANGQCMHDGTRFTCQERPTCGRPFVVLGAARVASLGAAGDWAEQAIHASAGELDDELRAAVARHFVEAGLMEHASIAAFARFSLQLLALGAPAELISDTTRAMEDETRHARLCFGLAARYGSAAGPGALELTGALGAVDLLSVADLVITEGCIGETSAALEAAWAADAAEDAELRAVLSGIAEDELRHAALAFRFVAWAAQRDARVEELLARRVREARDAAATVAPASERSQHAAVLAAHGVLDPATRAEARRRALEEIVSGALHALSAPRAPYLTSSMTVVSQPNKSSTLPAGFD
jgi:hypothetical protein